MRYNFLHFCLLGETFQQLFPHIHARELSTTEMELRDLVTQKSVIQRANMAAVMRNYRDGVVLTVERKSCLAAELRRSHASEDLFWAISVLEGLHMAISESIKGGQYMCLTKLTLKRHWPIIRSVGSCQKHTRSNGMHRWCSTILEPLGIEWARSGESSYFCISK